jgi:tRNA A37 methylthiotransferase MiaB
VTICEEEERSLNARADNYKKVIIKKGASNAPLGSRVRVKIGSASSNVLYGMPIETSKIVA